jgi:ubiquitin carboxyl-terminal hydrolase L3
LETQADQSPEPESTLSKLLAAVHDKSIDEAATVLEGSEELEKVYHAVETQGSTLPPVNAEDEVDYHYLCFVKGDDGSCLYELDGDREGPIKRCTLPPGSDMLSESVLKVIRSYLQAEGMSLEFSLMALCGSEQ